LGKNKSIFLVIVMIATMFAVAVPANLSADVNVSGTTNILSEVSIDVDPTNPNNQVIVGHSGSIATMNTFYSQDGGLTWTFVALGSAQDGLASTFRFDPTVAFDDYGNVYVGYGVRTGPPNQITVVVAKSTNGGQTYTQFTQVATTLDIGGLPGNDKWHLATGPDPSNPAQQNVYIAWTQNVVEGLSTDQRIVISRSTNGGATFSAPLIINDPSISGTRAGNLFADPAVGPNGEVYVAWNDIGAGQVFVDVSLNGGVNFGTDNLVTASGTGFKTSIPAQPTRGVFVGPTIDADRSNSPFKGRLYVTYTDLGPGGLPDTDIYVRYSDDDGATWSARTLVNDDTGTNSQFLPWLDVDQQTGLVTTVWYDARNDANNQLVEVFLGISDTGGASFQPNILVSDGASDMSSNNPSAYGGNYLEYIGVATHNLVSYPVWTDNSLDNTDMDFFTDQVSVTPVDVYILVDLSGSFWDDLPIFQIQAPDIIATLSASSPNIKFGLGKYEDYPIFPFGSAAAGDKAYERLVDLDFDPDPTLNAIAGLFTRDGWDWPQSQLPALYQAATGAGQDLSVEGYPGASIPAGQQANFRDGAIKLILLWTDAEFHLPGDPGDIPYPGPSFDDTVDAILALDPPMVIGISSGSTGTADLQKIATATDAFAPPGGVDYDGDGIIDILEGEPLVLTISASGEGIGEAMIAVVQAAIQVHINTPPVADADGPYTGTEGSPITFDGSGSYDPEGASLAYRWDFNNDAVWDTSWSSSPTTQKTWGDDHAGTAAVEVFDGTYTAISTASVTVNNVAPGTILGSSLASNGDFETGDFTGWTTYIPSGASASVATGWTGYYGTSYSPQDGSYFALLKTNGHNSYTTISQDIAMTAGDTLEGWAAFDARDYIPYNDNAAVRILQGGSLIATPWYSDVSILGNYGDGPWTSWQWTAPSSGTYTLEYRNSNWLDSVLDSYALFDSSFAVIEADEGDTVPFSGTFSDIGWLDTHTGSWIWGDGNPPESGTVTEENVEPDATGDVTGSHGFGDNGVFTVTLKVTDDDLDFGSDTIPATIHNVAPTITSLSGPLDPVNINNPVVLTGPFTDPGWLDTHTVTVDWDDGAGPIPGTVDETGGNGIATGSRLYASPGVYMITMTVTDDDGDCDSETYQYYVVVFDPDGGFITGGGWIDSPEGAFRADTTLTGKANFGFVSKYSKKDPSLPIGNTEFQFHAGDMNFHSEDYEWLIIAGAKGMYKGTGTINGAGEYKFIVTAIDAKLTHSTDVDKFRIRIWEEIADVEVVAYDNMFGADDDAELCSSTEITRGSIVIHKGK
jgi:hypothetical protein